MTMLPVTSLSDFLKKAKKYSIVPLTMEFLDDFITPVQLYAGLQDKRYSFLLESVEGEEKVSRYSFIGTNPLIVVSSKGPRVTVDDRIAGTKNNLTTGSDPLSELKAVMDRYRVADHEETPFDGGFVGYVGYDNVRFFEPILDTSARSKDAETCFVLPGHVATFDHRDKKLILTAFVPVGLRTASGLTRQYNAEIRQMKAFIARVSRLHPLKPLSLGKRKSLRVFSNFTSAGFEQAVTRAQEHIRAGDIIQVVLSQQMRTVFPAAKAFDAYRYLRMLNPSPYMYYLDFGKTKVAGASPEMLLRCERGVLTTRPIAGTRPRGKTSEEDAAFEKELLADAKEVAEHVMLVDLGRNDIGRQAENGTVTVPRFKTIERFSHVMHIVSEVRGRLRTDRTALDSFRACFPAGTLSGAPKIRAMQIIDELEPGSRGLYGGSIGYASFNGNLDMAIAIRTVVFKDGEAWIQAGAGIVLDSDPATEYQETLNKAKAQLVALELARH